MMTDAFSILNTVILIGVVASAFLAAQFEDLLSSIIALGMVGALLAVEFLLLQAPDVALAEVAVGAILSTVLFIITLRKVGLLKKGANKE